MIRLFILFHFLGEPSVKRLGLRSEIVLQLSLLMAAAMIFSSVLIMKFTEQELLDQRIQQSRSLLTLFAQSLDDRLTPTQIGERLRSQGQDFFEESHLQAFAVVNTDRQAFSARFSDISEWPVQQELNRSLLTREASLHVEYHGLWEHLINDQPDFFLLTTWLGNSAPNGQVLQARFSLADIKGRAFQARGFVMLYILLFGLILTLFGSYLLNKGVIRPVMLLHSATEQISQGNLGQQVKITNPLELSELADSFNRMSNALHTGRQKEQQQISALAKTNAALLRTRNELTQAAKMASIGHLAAGMAHEIGNPLGALTGYLDLLNQETDKVEIVGAAQNEAARIDRLVRDLLDYAHPESGASEPIDPGEVLLSSVRILIQQGGLGESRVKMDIPPALPLIGIAAHRLQQVLINLLQNAVDASLPDTTITLGASTASASVLINVSNQGEQIPAEELTSLFDPFFTTKSPDKGRGLGLFVCHNIISDAGGRIEVSSSPEGLTSFTLELPVVGEDHATA